MSLTVCFIIRRKLFAEFSHLDDKQKSGVAKEFEKWWNEFILRGKSELSEEEFVNMQNEDFKSDKDGLKKRYQEYFTCVLNIADIHHEGCINKEEWMALMKAYGHNNLVADEKYFQAFCPEDDKVPVHKIVEAFTQFATCEDSTVPDITKQAFDDGF